MFKKPQSTGQWIIWILVISAVLTLLFPQDKNSTNPNQGSNNPSSQTTTPAALVVNYSQFIEEMSNNNVSHVEFLTDGRIAYKLSNGNKRYTFMPNVLGNPMDNTILMDLEKKGVEYTGSPIHINSGSSSSSSSSSSIITMIVMIAIMFFLFRFMQNYMQKKQGGGGAGQHGKSKAKLVDAKDIETRFSDVAGCEEAIEEVKEVVDFLKEPDRFLNVGAKIPRGILLNGPPGTGKTLLAKAMAGEAGMAFLSVAGSEFVEMYVGVGASRVKDTFNQARKHGRCIIFIDEIDAVGGARGGAGGSGGHDEREQTLNQMLVEMDGFDKDDEIIIIAATNRPEKLDPALLRPGRFTRPVTVGLPDIGGREKILEVHAKGKPMDADVNLRVIASRTPGMSGADLANVLNEAAIFAARESKAAIDMWCIEKAIDKVIMGAERKSMIMTPKQKEETAMHEAAHALVGYVRNLQGVHDPVHRVSIMPRGRALGVTMYRPEEDRLGYKKGELLALVDSLHAGRLGELMYYDGNELNVSTGASNDLERASDIVRRMITEWGFSTELGTITAKADQFGRMAAAGSTLAEADKIAKEWLDASHERALALVKKHKDLLVEMTKTLMDVETIDDAEIERIFAPLDDIYANTPFTDDNPAKVEQPAEK